MSNKFLKKENKFLKKENKFLKESRNQIFKAKDYKEQDRKVFVEEVSNFLAHYLMGNPKQALEELKKLTPQSHLFLKRSLLEEVGADGFEEMYNKTKYRMALTLKQAIRDIDNFVPRVLAQMTEHRVLKGYKIRDISEAKRIGKNVIAVTKEEKAIATEMILKLMDRGVVNIDSDLKHKVAMDLVNGGQATITKKKEYGKIAQIRGVD